MTGQWINAITRAQDYAPYLARALDAQPDLAALLRGGELDAAFDLARQAGEGETDLRVALRREKQAFALTLAIGDLAGGLSLSEVTGRLSAFADRALDMAINEAIRYRVPDAVPAGFIALALGKHGAQELNYSSDIDPILLYDPDTLPCRQRDDPGDAAQRIARRVVETLSGVTVDGYVFRVDLRLRPASEVSPLAISLNAALTHYESLALTWERAAFIRARAAAGDIAEGERFLAAIRSFVWRRSLDFGAIAEIGRLTRQIRSDTRKSIVPGPGYNVKKGRGGIREIEFFAQVQQLVHGGRNPDLRVRGTRAALDALAHAGIIDPDDAVFLGQSYERLRTIEHRLQMAADQQTHSLPEDAAALDNVARLDGLADGKALVDELTEITSAVGQRYDALIALQSGSVGVKEAEPLGQMITRLGFAEPGELTARIEAWTSGKLRALRSDAACLAFEAVRPELLAAFAEAPDPMQAIISFERLLAGLPSAINLFHLLEARPALTVLLGRILSLAPPLADALARRADLLDPLLDSSAFDLPGSVSELTQELLVSGDDSYEHLLDRVRDWVGEKTFVLGVQLIDGRIDPLAISAGLARVAEAALVVLAQATVAEFEQTHGVVAGQELVVIGLGRMGGGMLTHASDLDLVFLFTGGWEAQSNGRRPLGATAYFNRLAQRIIAACSVQTARGALYEIDARLRPSGEQGPLVVSVDSFDQYQRKEAWTWEHMALQRARVLFGSERAKAQLNETIRAILQSPHDAGKLFTDVPDMRARIARDKPPRGMLDVKLLRGGLVDAEFLTHYFQLKTGEGFDPDISGAVRKLAALGLVPDNLAGAHDVLLRVLVAARLLAPDYAMPPLFAAKALAECCQCDSWDALLAAIANARRTIATLWQDTFHEHVEID